MSKRSIHPLGELIKNAIKESGITQATIAKRMDVPRQMINQIDQRKSFDLEFLQKLKNATGLDFTDHVFDPKAKKYVPIQALNMAEEPAVQYGAEAIELSLTIKVKAQESTLVQLSEMILFFKKEASNRGFQIA
jgi:transcriptional regulator with XRE-family HTH domain